MDYTSLLHVVFVVSLSAFVAVAQKPDTTTLVVTTATNEAITELPTTVVPKKNSEIAKPKVSSLHYDTQIKHRYASTHVTSKISNPADVGQEVHFQVTLPENAFISKFVMTIKNVGYEAYVKEKEEAKADYDAAVQAGFSAAHISLIDRDSNKFGVSVNVEAEGKVLFNLTYEEVLTRSLGHYSHIINVNPGQIVKDLAVNVKIQETSDITTLNVPSFKSTNEVTEGEKDNKLAKIIRNPNNPKEAEVTWSPDYEQQKEMAKDGLKGRLIIEYDVERKQHPSQILIEDGHFVHFFAPSDLPPLRKQVVFVLDISGSMFGEKITQLKDAMRKILSDLNPQDHFSIVLFSDSAYVWSKRKTPVLKKVFEAGFYNIDNETTAILDDHRDEILQATPDNIKVAKEFVEFIKPTTSTNIMDGLRKGLKLVEEGKNTFNTSSEPSQPIMFFLTDGEPNVDLTDPQEIVNETSTINEELKTPIYSLAFGQGADIEFLKKLSKANHGFARNIYEGSDATLQLNNFYKEISSPLLANVTFVYPSGDVDKESITERAFPIYFEGGELVVLGKISKKSADQPKLNASYSIQTKPGSVDLKKISEIDYCFSDTCHPTPIPYPPINPPRPDYHGNLEKMWAYLTIKQLLEKDLLNQQSDKNSTEKRKALDLALKYKFVTPLTSLVVVKPNETAQAVQPEKSDSKHGKETSLVYHRTVASKPIITTLRKGPPSASPLSVKYAMAAYPHHSIAGGHPGGFSGGGIAAFAAPIAPAAGFGGGGSNYNMLMMAGAPPSSSFTAGFPGQQIPYMPPIPPQPISSGDRIDLVAPESEPESTEMSIDSTTAFIDPTTQVTQSHAEMKLTSIHGLKWLNITENHPPTEEPVIELLTGEPPESHNYTVGINKTSSYFDKCISPEGDGFCKHIEHCALTTFELNKSQYSPYFCPITGQGSSPTQIYAGVCCPTRFVFQPPPPPITVP